MRRLIYILVFIGVFVGFGYAMILLMGSGAASFRVEGSRLLISGNLTLLSTERIDSLVEQNAEITVVVLEEIDPASDPVALLQKGALIRSLGLNTQVAPGVTVAGDAVYLFLGGVERHLAGGAQIAVSDWQSDVGPASALVADHPAHTERRGHVAAMLGAPDFYEFAINAAPVGGGHVMSDAELAEFNLATRF